MSEQKIENQDSQNLENEENLENQDDSQDADEETIDSYKQKNQSLYEQLKKAKGFVRDENGKWIKKEQPKPEVKETKQEAKNNSGLSQKDIILLAKADIHEDDIDEVLEYASFKKISVSEALKSDVVKTILSNKSEYRKTAQASNTGNAKKSVSKVSDDTLIAEASKGNIPKKGSEEAERLFWARRGGKKA